MTRTPTGSTVADVLPLPAHADLAIDRRADWHTHTDLVLGADCAVAVVDAAQAAGLTTVGLTDRVHVDTAWLEEYALLARAFHREGLEVRCGVEAAVLDVTGRLDLPADLPALDHVVLVVDDLPGGTGPLTAAEVRSGLTSGALDEAGVVDQLVTATVAAVRACPVHAVVGRVFGLLATLDIAESVVTDDHLATLAAACREAGAAVEINERWATPSPRIATVLAGAGVELVAGSDALHARNVGVWDHVATLSGGTTEPTAPTVEPTRGNADPAAAVAPAATVESAAS